jgi:toxin ParE1/3/4
MAKQSSRFQISLSDGAERDLESIYDYISEFDSVSKANHVLDCLMEIVEGLAQFPERGSCPKEFERVGIKEYRQSWFKPYRVIYRVEGQRVIIYLIADGRRDMQSLLSRRLLGA